MPKFIAQTSRGLEDALYDEMMELALPRLKKIHGGIEFDGPWAECYRANLMLRLATRVLLPILDYLYDVNLKNKLRLYVLYFPDMNISIFLI